MSEGGGHFRTTHTTCKYCLPALYTKVTVIDLLLKYYANSSLAIFTTGTGLQT